MAYRKLVQANPRAFSQFVELTPLIYMACCDCGLVHDVQTRMRNGKLVIRVRRNATRTKARRAQVKHAKR